MNKQKTVDSKVLAILRECPETRYDDMQLILCYYNRYSYMRVGDLPLEDIVNNYKGYGLPCFETIRRATIIFTVYSKTVLPIRRLKICKIKSITEKPQEPTSHELPKGSAMTLPEFMVFLFQSKDKQTNKRGDENGLPTKVDIPALFRFGR